MPFARRGTRALDEAVKGEGDTRGRASSPQGPAKFAQICASQDDLFALDEKGDVYQFNFNTKLWIELGAGQPRGNGRGQGHESR